jgi:hypothetical protein
VAFHARYGLQFAECVKVVALLAISGVVAAGGVEQPVSSALLEGQAVAIRFVQPSGHEKPFALGPWRLGARVRAPIAGSPNKPHDQRLNLYVVAPGTQNQSALASEFDHNLIINALPSGDRESEYDVYWAILLDPRLEKDLRLERDLLIAAQEEFVPGDLFEFDDLKAADFLRLMLKAEALSDLRRYRKKNGSLPRVLIVPAEFALRARIAE